MAHKSSYQISKMELTEQERYVWGGYNITIILLSFLGNSAIFITTNSALKLNNSILIVLKYSAANNLLYTLFSILPTVVELISGNEIVSHNPFCISLDMISCSYCLISGGLYCVLLIVVLLRVTSPLKTVKSTRVYTMCVVVWVLSLYLALQAGPVFRNSVCSDMEVAKVDWREKSDVIQGVGFIVLAIVIIVLFVLIALAIRERTAQGHFNQNLSRLAGVFIIAAFYIFSFLPSIAANMTTNVDNYSPALSRLGYLTNINVLTNIAYLIFLTNPQELVKKNMRACLVMVQNWNQNFNKKQENLLWYFNKKQENLLWNLNKKQENLLWYFNKKQENLLWYLSVSREDLEKQALFTAQKQGKDYDIWFDIDLS